MDTVSQGPLVSIVTPSYHQGRYIADTIGSVLNQDYPNLEYLVMDGGSTDGTVEILRQYGDRLVWLSEKDRGQADAINKGLRMARGEILGWLNSDDTYEPGAISKIVQYFRTHPDVALVYGEGHHIDAQGHYLERYPTEPFDRQRLQETCFICQPTVFFRAEVFRALGPLDADLLYCLDYEYWLRVAKRFRIGFLAEHLANSRLHGDTKTLARRVQVHEEILRVVKHHCGRVPTPWIATYAYFYLMEKLQPHLVGISKEGWASPCVRIFLRGDWRQYPYLLLQGTALGDLPSLCIVRDNQIVYKTAIQKGEFAVKEWIARHDSLPNDLPSVEVNLLTERLLTLRESELTGDSRSPAYRIRKLSLCDERGREVVLYTNRTVWLFLSMLPLLVLWKSLLINHRFPYAELRRSRGKLRHILKKLWSGHG
ncbi:MAG: glycosyltransferase, partial [Deltaproteobacteria bacterium]|nr:glycosyltransferase [Deltaproteobacteria bacterium]